MKKVFPFLLCMLASSLATNAQTTLKGRITLKGNSPQPLSDVFIQADCSNPYYTQNDGIYRLVCQGKAPGDMVSLTIIKKGYIVVDNALLKRVILSNNVAFDIVMQKESERKSEIDDAVKIIKTNTNKRFVEQDNLIGKRLDDLSSRLNKATTSETERSGYLSSINELKTERQQLVQEKERLLILIQNTEHNQHIQEMDSLFQIIKQMNDKPVRLVRDSKCYIFRAFHRKQGSRRNSSKRAIS